MKKKIGELNGKAIVVGNQHFVTTNEYLYQTTENGFTLSKRGANGKLQVVTAGAITSEPEATAFMLEDESTEDIKDQIKNILTEE